MARMTKIMENAADLERELTWFRSVLEARLELHLGKGAPLGSVLDLAPPDLGGSSSEYAGFVRRHQLSFVERLALVLALVPHLRPQLLDVCFARDTTMDR